MAVWQTPAGAVVRLFGTQVGVVYGLVDREVDRRQAARLGAVTRLDVLDSLLGLPVGMPVAWSELTARERDRINLAPRGAVSRRNCHVVREAVPPLTPRVAVVAADGFRTGLRRAGQFAPFCARMMLLPAPPSPWERTQAAYWGVGLAVLVDGRTELVVDLKTYVPRRHTPARWWSAEEVYRQVIDQPEGCPADGQAGSLAQALNDVDGLSAPGWWSRLLATSFRLALGKHEGRRRGRGFLVRLAVDEQWCREADPAQVFHPGTGLGAGKHQPVHSGQAR